MKTFSFFSILPPTPSQHEQPHHTLGSMIVLALLLLLMFLHAQAADAATASKQDLFSMSLDELLDIEVVTANRQSEDLIDSISTTYVITGEELRSMGARNIYDALVHVPGITYARNKAGANKVFFRGAGSEYSSQIIFMIDSHVINDLISGGLGMFTDMVAIDNIKRIEVVHGPVSSLYGANAYLGMINIITRDGQEINGTHGRFRAEYDRGGHVANYYNILAGRSFTDGWKAAINLHCKNGDGPELYVKKDAFDHSGYADASQELYNIDLRVENSSFSLKSHYFHRNGGGYFGIANVLGDHSNIGVDYFFLDAIKTFQPLQDFEVKLRAGYDFFKNDSKYETLPKGSIPEGSIFSPWNDTGYTSRTEADQNQYFLELTSNWQGFDTHNITLGMSYRYQELTDPKTYSNSILISTGSGKVPVPLPDMTDVSDMNSWITPAHRNNYAVYLQDTWEPADRLKFTFSGRYDYFTDFGSTFNPKAGIGYEFFDGYQFRVVFGTAFRAPDFASQFVQNNIVIQGNDNLDPERIYSVEAGIRAYITDRLYCEGVYYHNEMKDLIGLDSNSPRVYQNNSDVTVDGIELSARYDWDNLLQVMASYSWRDVRADRQYSSITVPAHSGSLGINWSIAEFLNWNIQLYAQSTSPRMYNDTRSDLDAYALLDSTLLFRPCSYAEIEFSVHNITDEDYAYPAAPYTIPGDYTAPGRSFLFGLRLSY